MAASGDFLMAAVNPEPMAARMGAEQLAVDGTLLTRRTFAGPTVGRAIHEVIQELAQRVGPVPTTDDIMAAVERHPLVARCVGVQHRQMARRRLGPPAGAYFNRHSLKSSWRLIGTEVSIGDVRADVVWRVPGGQVVVDELKSSRWTLADASRLRGRVDRHLAAAVRCWEDELLVVRLCVLQDPRQSYCRYSDGTVAPVEAR